MLIKNEFPLLEYDTSSPEVITPNHDCLSLRLPEKCVFAFLGNAVADYVSQCSGRVVHDFVNVSRITPIYVAEHEGEEICLVQSPVGAPAAVQILDTLIACGCRKIVSVGSCGVLRDIAENAFLVPRKALRAEGTSCHYLPAARYIELDREAVSVISDTFRSLSIPFEYCVTWSTDGFFRETREMVAYRVSEGCDAVEMECAALAACAEKRGAHFGEFFFTADSLAGLTAYDPRNFGADSHKKALLLALSVLHRW